LDGGKRDAREKPNAIGERAVKSAPKNPSSKKVNSAEGEKREKISRDVKKATQYLGAIPEGDHMGGGEKGSDNSR